jgi:tellurite resistance-related uncharacterized protein
MSTSVYVVHCIDTEGPFYESLEATFERLNHIFHLNLKPDKQLLAELQAGTYKLNGLETAVQNVVDPHLLNYNDTWDKIDAMLDRLHNDDFRNGWIYNWFCIDHVNHELNPRRRDVGYHNIFDHYKSYLKSDKNLHFHFHPQPFKRDASLCATHWWASSNILNQTLCRKIIDRNWFPCVNRPGFQVNRPDSHWFMEQFIPFDMSSLAIDATPEDKTQFDLSNGRSGDWRRAPKTWTPYHPSHDDYQIPGNCRRWIARCLNVGTRAYCISDKEVKQAFQEAEQDKPVVMSFADHDFRNIAVDVDYIRNLLEKHATVNYVYSDVITAMRKALELKEQKPCNLKLSIEDDVLTVKTDIPTFGPQPYLAIKTVTDTYHHDNFDFQEPNHEWTYVFDSETYPLKAVDTIGVATNNAYGITSVATIKPDGTTTHRSLNT